MKKLFLIYFLIFINITALASEPAQSNYILSLAQKEAPSFDEIYLLQLNGYKLSDEQIGEFKEKADKGSFPNASYIADLIRVLDYQDINIYDFAGHNLLEELYNYKYVFREGVLGMSKVLSALNCHYDEIPLSAVNTPLIFIDEILSYQNSDGGFPALMGEVSNAEISASVISALAPYTYLDYVNNAVCSALDYISTFQNSDATFTINNITSSITVSKVIIAALELKIDPTMPQFKKSSITLIDALNKFRLKDGSFSKIHYGDTDSEASVFANLALLSLERVFSGKNPIYNLDGFFYECKAEEFADSAEISENSKKYIDIARELGIVQGDSENYFHPKNKITRAEFVTMLLRALDYELTDSYSNYFEDVKPTDWYWNYVLTAKYNNIINGTGPSLFSPEKNIIRQDIAVILTNLYPMDINYETSNIADYPDIADYAKNAVLMCMTNEIFDLYSGSFLPREEASREDVVVSIVRYIMYLAVR